MITTNRPDNKYKEEVNRIKKMIENEEDKYKQIKLIEQLYMPNLFSMEQSCYAKYKNPW